MAKKQFHHIAIACDNSFVNHSITMLFSLFKNNSNHKFHIHILDSQINLKNKLKLKAFFFRVGYRFQFYSVDHASIKNAPVNDHINLSTYNRIFLSSLISSEIHELIYLDSDVLIVDKIDPLLNCDVSDFFLAAVIEIIPVSDKRRLGFEEDDKYFNAGILKINLKKWRENDLQSTLVEFIKNNPEKIKYWDQDVLNYCLKGKWKQIDRIFNVTHFFFYPNIYPPSYFGMNEDEYSEILDNPAIIHFTSHQKPWIEGCPHPEKDLYFNYQLTAKKLIFGRL